MSAWIKAEDDEIDIDVIYNEVDIYVLSNSKGRVYVTLSFDQIKEIAKKINQGSNDK